MAFNMHKSRNLSEKKRRDQFNVLINELCAMVTSANRKMDKSTVLRSTISFLKNHNELALQSRKTETQENWKPSFLSSEEFTHLMLEALDGFIIVFSRSGNIQYTSESTASLLGYPPGQICSSIFDIVHESDKSSLYKLINNSQTSANNFSSNDSFMSLFLHLKRGPMHSQSNSSYEMVRLVGTYYHWPATFEASTTNYDCDSNSSVCSPMSASGLEWRSCFVAIGQLQIPHLLRVVNLSEAARNEFTSRHSLEWKFLFLDHRAPPVIGYLPFEILGTSGYDYYHMDDLDKISTCHELLKQTGEGTSCVYRFLTKGQQWIWLRTRYYISYHQWNSKPEFIVCTHTVVSNEKAIKNAPESTQHYDELSKKNQSLIRANSCNQPTISACISPSASISSLGSVSSEQSEKSPYEVYSSLRRSETANLSPNQTPLEPMASMQASPHSQLSVPQCFSSIRSSVTVSPIEAIPSVQSQGTVQSEALSDVSVQTILQQTGFATSLEMSNSIAGSQQHEASLQPVDNQAQMQDFLYRRHQLLQQQILMQQEELRRVSEQLRLVQFAPQAPGPVANGLPFQVNEEPELNFMDAFPPVDSQRPSGVGEVVHSPHPNQAFVTSTSYIHIEAEFPNAIPSEELPHHVSQQQSGETKDSHFLMQ